jgi:dihydrofolate reductase/thymidylate synthase
MVKYYLISAYLKKSKIMGIKTKFNKYTLPWNFMKEDMKYFKNKTEKKVVIMGRNTFTSMDNKPLKNRINIVISSKLKEQDDITIKKSIKESIKYCEEKKYKKVFFIGGYNIYKESFKYIEKLYITEIISDVNIQENIIKTIKFPEINKKYFKENKKKSKIIIPKDNKKIIINFKEYNKKRSENNYLDSLKNILKNGYNTDKTIFLTGITSKYDLIDPFSKEHIIPLFTTKKVFWRGIVEELLWFIRGETNTKILEEKGINIWKENSSKKYLFNKGFLNYEEGDIGPGYGFQWRNCGAEYKSLNNNKGIDQIKNVINSIKSNPYSRRHIINAWNVNDIDKMVLPPCHAFFQFHVIPSSKDNIPKYLSIQLYQRSADMGLGVPFNVASYSLLCYIIGKETNLVPLEFIHNIGNAHIYKDHIPAIEEQIKNKIYDSPTINFSRKEFDKYKYEDFKISNYKYNKCLKKMNIIV